MAVIPEKRFAWWYLSKLQKRQLRALRQAGEFGGTPGEAPYFWVQEGSTEQGRLSAYNANIKSTHFVAEAEDAFDANWANVIDRLVFR